MLTPFGKVVRKMRIDLGITLKNMAESIGLTSSYLSAIETGKRAVTDKILQDTISFLAKNENDINDLKQAANDSVQFVEINLNGKNEMARTVAVSFAKNFDHYCDETLSELLNIMNQNIKMFDCSENTRSLNFDLKRQNTIPGHLFRFKKAESFSGFCVLAKTNLSPLDEKQSSSA